MVYLPLSIRAICFLLLFFLSNLAFAQSGAIDVDGTDETTEHRIQRLRQQKALHLEPPRSAWLHRIVLYVRQNKIPEKITYGYGGFRPRFGTLGPGSGFGVGVEYYRPDLADERVTVRSSLTGSLQRFFMVDGEFEARRIGGSGFVNLLGFQRFSPNIDFYGEGPESSLNNRTGYSLHERNVQLTAGSEIRRRVRVGTSLRFRTSRAGDTRSAERPPVQSVFSPSQFPDLVFESSYFEAGGFFALAPRNDAGSAAEGNWASLQFSQFISQTPDVAGFTRGEVLFQRTQLFLNQQRAVVLRARTVRTSQKSGSVPFYLQPQLGGPDDLRGFRGRRFVDNNLFSTSAEYQWQILSEVSLALFTDVGKVFPHWNDWSLQHMEHSFGGGVRFGPTGDRTSRIDVAAGREGVQFWVVFANF